MKYNFKFNNLLGTVYKKGNLIFTPDGGSLISPVGNRLTVFNLKSNKAETLPIETTSNIVCTALSPNGYILIAATDRSDLVLCSTISRTVLRTHHIYRPATIIKFSLNGRLFAVAKDQVVKIYKTPGVDKCNYNMFNQEQTLLGAYDEISCVNWSSDSQYILVGCKDMSTRLYKLDEDGGKAIKLASLGGHTDVIVDCSLVEDLLDCYTVSSNGQLCSWAWSCDEKTEPAQAGDTEPEVQEQESKVVKHFYRKIGRIYLCDNLPHGTTLTATTYHQKTKILVAAFSNGDFLLYEMPDATVIQSLSLGAEGITTMQFDPTGDWLALASATLGQLVVWEWQSESFILKQQSHYSTLNCLDYSPDGQNIVTGGDDAKVKMWNTESGLCYATFSNHESAVTGVVFLPTNKAVVSCSLDGTVRAFDLSRYRNFRTLTSPTPVQMSCVTADSDFVCAGCHDNYDIYVWSLKAGRLVEILSGHESSVSSLSFWPATSTLASTSWDKTLRLWSMIDGNRETIQLMADGLCVRFKPDGTQVAVSTLDGTILTFDVDTMEQRSSVEGKRDLAVGRTTKHVIKSSTVRKSRAFNSFCYTADGDCILAGGDGINVCLYDTREQLLLRSFLITSNRSLDGVEQVVNVSKRRKVDRSSRMFDKVAKVSSVCFCPTGRSWASTTTEGLLVFTLDTIKTFDPFGLDTFVTVDEVIKALEDEEWAQGIMLALRLGDSKLIERAFESVPSTHISMIVPTLSIQYLPRILKYLAFWMERTKHVELSSDWLESILVNHAKHIKETDINAVQRVVAQTNKLLSDVCERARFNLRFIEESGSLRVKEEIADIKI